MFTESYEDDIDANDVAASIYDDVMMYFTNIPTVALEKYKKTLNGGLYHGFTIATATIGTIMVAFSKSGGNMRGAFGFTTKGMPFILLYLLNDEWNPKELKKLKQPSWRSTFIHEATHIIDNKRFKSTYKNPNTGKDLSEISMVSYYNSPSEMNTFFQELVTDVRRIDDEAKEHLLMIYKTPIQLTNYFYDTNYWDKDQYLTTANRNRIKKRIFRLVSNFFKVDK